MVEKIIGYTILAIGVIIIVFSAINIFLVFTGQSKPVNLFNFPAVSLDLGQSLGLPGGVKTKPTELVSAEVLNQTSNIFAQLLLMGFMASIGQKLASLGVSLVRPIVVKLKEEKL